MLVRLIGHDSLAIYIDKNRMIKLICLLLINVMEFVSQD